MDLGIRSPYFVAGTICALGAGAFFLFRGGGLAAADDGGGYSETIALAATDTAAVVASPVSVTAAVPLPSRVSSAKATARAATSVSAGVSSPAPSPVLDPEPSSSPPRTPCSFPDRPPAAPSMARSVIFNEIAWMGSPASSLPLGTSPGNAEWMELKNVSSAEVALTGWEMENSSGKIVVRFGDGEKISPGGFLLLVRGSTTFPYAHASEVAYAGDLRNSGDDLALLDPTCASVDYIAASAGWPAGDNDAKRTMERDDDRTGWHTSADAGGSPGAENSAPLPSSYTVSIALAGATGVPVTSDPPGLSCTSVLCSGTFAAGARLSLKTSSAGKTIFDGWSGACSGRGLCEFIVGGPSSVTAAFHILPPDPAPEIAAAPASTDEAAAAATQPPLITITEVRIAGAKASNDLVKLHNSSAFAADLGGWKLKKRSASGAEYSLRTIPAGTMVAAGGDILWANSADGFATSVGADISSTETLAADNSVAVIDAAGSIIDAVAWGKGQGQYGEGAPYPDSPASGQVLARRSGSDSAFIDTGDNASDFILIDQ